MDLLTIDQFAMLAQAAGEPDIDGMFVAKVLSRALHLLCAIIIGGGLFYLRTILSPAGSDACFAGRRATWARWVGIATFVLLVSGLFNFMMIIKDAKAAGDKLPPTYHMLFGLKFLLSLLVLFIAAILAGKTGAAERFRGNMSRWLNIAWTAVMAIVILGAILRMYHLPDPDAVADRPAVAQSAAEPSVNE